MEVVDSDTAAAASDKAENDGKEIDELESVVIAELEPEETAELEPEVTAELDTEVTVELISKSTSEATADTAEPRVLDTLESTSVSSEVEDPVGNGMPVAKTYLVLPVAVVVVSELYELV